MIACMSDAFEIIRARLMRSKTATLELTTEKLFAKFVDSNDVEAVRNCQINSSPFSRTVRTSDWRVRQHLSPSMASDLK